MDEKIAPGQQFCPQCGDPTDLDAKFCKNCAFHLVKSDERHVDLPSGNVSPSKSKLLIPLVVVIGLLGILILGLLIGLATFRNQTGPGNTNAALQSANTGFALTEMAQRIEERIIRGESLSSTDIEGLGSPELRILRNVHFAKYGRKYERPGLGDYFFTRPWYKPNDSFSDSMLTQTDKENVKMILSAEEGTAVESNDSNSSTDETFQEPDEAPRSMVYSEAQDLAEKFWKQHLTKCGNSYSWEVKRNSGGMPIRQIYQCKGEPSIFAEGEEFTPRFLSEADKLNGVDPLPEQWRGKAKVFFAACRTSHWNRYYRDGWDEWKDNVSYDLEFWKAKGKWNFPNDFLRLNVGAIIVKLFETNFNKDELTRDRF
jgi:YARHG domain